MLVVRARYTILYQEEQNNRVKKNCSLFVSLLQMHLAPNMYQFPHGEGAIASGDTG